jgi:catechol 2,3-dioxygenase-like lactoylglutathione lyase family enzyme
MIAHTSLLVRDYNKSKGFYTKVLATLGYTQNMEFGESAGFNDGKNTDFWITTHEKGVIPSHVAFEATDKAALQLGAQDNGAPGYRREYWPGYYAAFVHDADGHNIEVVFFDYDEK